MRPATIGPELQRLIDLLARLPGLGPRSAKRAALFLLKKREPLMRPLAFALADAADKVGACGLCGNWDSIDPCAICADPQRAKGLVCVVQDVGDLWALERAGVHRGVYHVLGGLLSPLDGVGPSDLNLDRLAARARAGEIEEAILALPATVDGQSTAHYLGDLLKDTPAKATRLSHGVPIGGELDHLDEGTLSAALKARRPV